MCELIDHERELNQQDKRIAQLEVALTLIGDVAFDRDGHTGDAEKLGALIDEIYGYARNPQTAVDALADTQENGKPAHPSYECGWDGCWCHDNDALDVFLADTQESGK